MKVIEQNKSFFCVKVQKTEIIFSSNYNKTRCLDGAEKILEWNVLHVWTQFTAWLHRMLVSFFSQDFMAQFTSEFLNLHQFPASQKWWWIAVKKGIRKIVDKTPANLASSRIIKRSAKNEENIKCTTTKRDERDHNWDPDEICIFTVATCKVSIKPLSFNYQLVLPIIHTATCSASRS